MREGAGRLVEAHVGLASALATRYLSRIPNSMDHDAIRGAALEGLCIAANSYDPVKGSTFVRWASRRIIGAMRDEMREQDHLSRRARARTNPGNRLYDPGFLKVDSSAPRSLDRELEFVKGGAGETLTLKDTLQDHNARDPSDSHAISRPRLFGMVASLPDREFRVVTLRYFGGMRLSEIATSMNLSESRVSQIEGMALERLRNEPT